MDNMNDNKGTFIIKGKNICCGIEMVFYLNRWNCINCGYIK